MFADQEISDTIAIIPARQLNMEAYHCWFGGQLILIQCPTRLGLQKFQQIL